MAKNKDITYSRFQRYIKNKDTAVNHYIDNYLTKTQAMFVYDGLPDTIPADELERILQTSGNCFVTKVDGELYALTGGLGGEPDAYNRPTQYTVANPALKLTKTYDIEKDGVLVKNDFAMQGLLPIIGKYAVLLTDSTISLNTGSILTRVTMLISAADDKTKQSADVFLQKILDGDFSVIGENAFFNGVKMQTAPTANSVYISQLIELVQYYKASLLNELGLNANYNMKRERLNQQEVSMNIDALLPFVDNMLAERVKAVDKINEMFGTEITVDLSSVWKVTHEESDRIEAIVETDTENETGQETETEHPSPDTDPEPDPNKEQESTEGIEDTEQKETIETEVTDPDEKDKEDEK